MPKFNITAFESILHEFMVEAKSFNEACELANANPDIYFQALTLDSDILINKDISTQHNFVIESKQEKGYWSNKNGWGSLEDATIFEYKPTSFPSIGVSDCRLVTYRDAEMDRVDGDAD